MWGLWWCLLGAVWLWTCSAENCSNTAKGKLGRAVKLLFLPDTLCRSRRMQYDAAPPETALPAGCSSGGTQVAKVSLKSQVAGAGLISTRLHCRLAAI